MERDARSSRRFRDRAVLSSVKSSSSRSNRSSRSQKAAFSMETDYTSGFSYPEPTPAPKKQRRRVKWWRCCSSSIIRRRLFAILVLLLVLCCPILLVWNQYDFVRLALLEQQVMQQQQLFRSERIGCTVTRIFRYVQECVILVGTWLSRILISSAMCPLVVSSLYHNIAGSACVHIITFLEKP